jgi:hypothetical protein
MSEYFGIIATSESGSTATMELVSGREKAAQRAEELIESGHSVRLYTCKSVKFEIRHTATIDIQS